MLVKKEWSRKCIYSSMHGIGELLQPGRLWDEVFVKNICSLRIFEHIRD